MVTNTQTLKRSGSGQSFFRLVQSHLQDKFSGRLLALILCELGRQEPGAFVRFLDFATPAPTLGLIRSEIAGGRAQFEREWCYRPGRYADLAILVRGEPAVLIEVKEDDVSAPRNPKQLNDYCDYIAKQPKATFIHVSRYTPLKALPKLLQAQACGRVHDVRYRHLYRAVVAHEEDFPNAAPLSRMIREYLEDIGVDAYKTLDLEVDRTALTFLVTQMTSFDHFHGLGRLQSQSSTIRGPDILRILLGNVAVLGDWLQECNSSIVGQRPQCRFYTNRHYSPDALARAARETKAGELAQVPRKAIREGVLSVATRAKLKVPGQSSASWSYVDVGYYISVSSEEKERARLALYAEIYWKGDSVYLESADWLKTFPSETEATAELRSLLKKAVARAKKKLSYPSALDSFTVPVVRG